MTTVKGWCPGAYSPMMSGDGLIVRVRPRMGQLSAAQAQGLCAAAERFGNGLIDLTSRANVQLRGVAHSDHPSLLETLGTLGLLDANPAIEARRGRGSYTLLRANKRTLVFVCKNFYED